MPEQFDVPSMEQDAGLAPEGLDSAAIDGALKSLKAKMAQEMPEGTM
ncbi:MAG: hypothetical protein Greene041662_329 [Candidatus Peregrinibacteria bacterium Greene0416_62]|nr:MAG: hypothetical protein Greene041662_329 [Candidatus Peregrinibacteria bacterium Greene0416_62]TSC97661.1 MAG: hypothetical protein Greene101449_1127 [Candidatus Peregrinibacteria bacterium Greene1014_49]